MITKRIAKEVEDVICRSDKSGIIIHKNAYNYSFLMGTIMGPKCTPYEGGKFKINIQLPIDYPFKPPKIKFVTQIYHCNINKNGDICLDLLKDQWSPTLTLERLLLSVIALLINPNPNDPLVPDIAELYRRDKTEHDNVASSYTLKYAT